MIEVAEAGPGSAAEVLSVIREGFGSRELLDPPASALTETVESVAAALAEHGGLLAVAEEGAVGACLFVVDGPLLVLRRLAVRPDEQGRGVARSLVRRAELVARSRGLEGVKVDARRELPRTVRLWEHLGYSVLSEQGPTVTFVKMLPVEVPARTAEDTRDLGQRLAGLLRAGDLVILSGDLGAGKTTFTQGLGAGLGVRGGVTSPTFVISRVHPSLGEGPPLVHVDAYRLGGVGELDDLDLDTTLEEAVTVVEWGENRAEGLAEDRLEVRISRARADSGPAAAPDDEEADDPRSLVFAPVGARWAGSGLAAALDDDSRGTA